MPIFHALPAEKIEELTKRGAGGAAPMDLTPYVEAIDAALDEGKNGTVSTGYLGSLEVDLGSEDNVRAIKRRLTIAANGKDLGSKWHRKSSNEKLYFLLYDKSNPKFVRRTRSPRTEDNGTQTRQTPPATARNRRSRARSQQTVTEDPATVAQPSE